jgi:hypothetical protein
MESSCSEFVEKFIKVSPGLHATYMETLDYWSPEEPPTTILFGDLGIRIADDFEKVDAAVNSQIFSLIETAIISGDDALITAIATGTIEAVFGRVATEHWPNVLNLLGERSRKYAEAWLAS